MLDLSDIRRGLQGLEPFYRNRAADGLRAVAPEVTAQLQSTTAHGDVTGATRASYRAYVVTPEDNGASVVAEAAQVVERLNPGASATSTGRLDGAVGLILTSLTNYQDELEESPKATLGPTLAANAASLTRRIAEGR